MKSTFKKLTIASLISASFMSSMAYADISGNIGVVSQYYFRGIAQTTTASASAGLDYNSGGFNAGTWVGDVSDGVEVDFYASYSDELSSGLGWSAGFKTYQYTGDFDSAYNEVFVGLNYGLFSFQYFVGTRSEDADLNIAESDYSFASLTIEKNGFYATYGTHGKDSDGDYIELGYGTEVSGFDVGVSLISNSKELDVETGKGEETIIFSLGKSF